MPGERVKRFVDSENIKYATVASRLVRNQRRGR
jgi:hypothetical protein